MHNDPVNCLDPSGHQSHKPTSLKDKSGEIDTKPDPFEGENLVKTSDNIIAVGGVICAFLPEVGIVVVLIGSIGHLIGSGVIVAPTVPKDLPLSAQMASVGAGAW